MTFTLDTPAAELDQTRQHARYLKLRIARAQENLRAGRVQNKRQFRLYFRSLLDEYRDTQLRVAQMEEDA